MGSKLAALIVDLAVVLAIIAIIIAGASLLWTIGWSVYTHRRTTRPRLRVTAAWSLPVYGPQLGDPAISITAANDGLVPVTVSGARLQIRGRSGTIAPFDWVIQTPANLAAPARTGRPLVRDDRHRVRDRIARARGRLGPSLVGRP